MSATLEAIQRLVAAGDVRISEHGYDELANDGIAVRDILEGVSSARLVEDYPTFGKGPAVLVLESDAQGKPVHVSGAFRRGTQARRFWSRRIGRIRARGAQTFCGGANE